MARKLWVQLAVAAIILFFTLPPLLAGSPFMLGVTELPTYAWIVLALVLYAAVAYAFGWWRLPAREEAEEMGTPIGVVFEATRPYLYNAMRGAYMGGFRAWILNADTNFRGRGKGARLIGVFPLRELRPDLSLFTTSGYNKSNKMSRNEMVQYICDECPSENEQHHPTDFLEYAMFLERKPTIRTIEQAKARAIEELTEEGRYEEIPALARGVGGTRITR